MRPDLRDRVGHPRDARRRGAPRGRARGLKRFLPAPVLARSGFERAAFSAFVLACGLAPAIALANIALALMAVSAILWRLDARRKGGDLLGPFRAGSPIVPPIAAFVLLTALSAAFSTLPERSLPELKGLFTFGLVVFAPALLTRDGDVDLLLDVWRVTAAYLVVRGLVDWTRGADNLEARISGGLSVYMTYAGILMTLALVFLGRGLDGSRKQAQRGIDLALAAAGAALVALTFTRNAYIGLGVGCVVLAALTAPRLLLVLPVLALVAGLVLPAGVRARALSAFDPDDATIRDRFLMWRAGAAMVADRPLFGLGPKRVKDLYPVYRLPGFVLPDPGHLHNNVVHVAAETGIPSALAYVSFVLAFFVHAWRRLESARRAPVSGSPRSSSAAREQAVVRSAMAAMAAIFVAGLFESNFADVEVLIPTLVIASLPFVPAWRRAEAPAPSP